MLREIEYNLTYANNALTVSTSDSELFSQYEEVLIKVNITGIVASLTAKLHISNPDNIISPSTAGYEYDNVFHLIPSVEGTNKYYLRLTEALGKKLKVGDLNTCNMKFEVLTSNGTSLSTANRQISLYKTNTDISYQPDDLTQLFIAIAQIENRISKLEEK